MSVSASNTPSLNTKPPSTTTTKQNGSFKSMFLLDEFKKPPTPSASAAAVSIKPQESINNKNSTIYKQYKKTVKPIPTNEKTTTKVIS